MLSCRTVKCEPTYSRRVHATERCLGDTTEHVVLIYPLKPKRLSISHDDSSLGSPLWYLVERPWLYDYHLKLALCAGTSTEFVHYAI